MIHEITVEGLARLSNPVFIDVRSESEFAEATIPGAINMPLFTDAERAKVGTVYKQVSPIEAKDLGLSLAAPKLSDMVQKCRHLKKSGELVFFCWRGGMRSRSVSAIMDLMGLPVYRLVGGYKAYRHSIVEFWEKETLPFRVVVIRGNTGTGKTELIQALQRRGKPAVDLEKLANNRGSVFGAVGLGDSPSQKMFEALLTESVRGFGNAKYIVVECESKRIGRVTLPNKLHQAMQEDIQILVYDSIPNRVKRLVDDYTSFLSSQVEIEAALEKLVKRLGHVKTEGLREMLTNGNYPGFAQVLLEDYYDPLYGYPNKPDSGYSLCVSMASPAEALVQVEQFLDSLEENCGAALPGI